VDLLHDKGLLLADADGVMMTTRGAIALEQQVLDLARTGQGQGTVLVDRHAGAAVQQVARELALRRLSPRQEAAAALILSSKDRIVGVQGVAGAGKSTMLQPVTRIAEAQGRNVVALAVGAQIAQQLGKDLGVPSNSVTGFLYRHQALLIDDGLPDLKQRSLHELSGSLIIVDEASTLSSRQAADLIRIAHTAGAARLAMVGDTRQYGAVEAGKPFSDLQKAGLATAELTDNVRARSDIMRSLAPVLDAGDMAGAFRILEPVTHEVPRGDAAAHAVALWAQRPREEREATLILTSGRALRAEANREAQALLKSLGEIGQHGQRLTVLDRVNLSREEARTMAPYREGLVVQIRTDMPRQGLTRGMIGTITSVTPTTVELRRGNSTWTLRPDRLARNLKEDAIGLFERRDIELHERDRIRFTANNPKHGVLNAQAATVEAISAEKVVLKLAEDQRLELPLNDPALKRIDLGYAINTYAAQGVTTTHGIVVMDSHEKMLSSSRTLSVALTRIADQPTLVLDSAERLERAVGRHDAGKTSALDIYRAMTAAKEEPKIERKELQKEMTRERSIDKEIGARERGLGFWNVESIMTLVI
jgi:ATP-dependent exoDNAse (exonuclease V) alpha subunit